MKRIICIIVTLCLLVVSLVSCKGSDYKEALKMLEEGKYEEAKTILEELGDYKDCPDLLSNFHYVPVTATDENGTVYTYIYNDQNLLSQIVGEWCTYSCTYDKNNVLTSIKYDGGEEIIEYFFDANGYIVQIVEGKDDQFVESFVNNTYGDPIKYISPYGEFILEHTYDNQNNLIKTVETSEDGEKSVYTYAYDDKGDLIKETTPYRETMYTYTYDSNNNLIKKYGKSDHDFEETYTYLYDNNGNVIKTNAKTSYNEYQISITYKLVYTPHQLPEAALELLSGNNLDW